MSTHNDIDITCEKCEQDFRGTVWTAVNARQDPELKDLLLGGELNLVMCPQCGHVAFHDHFLLYHDPAAEFLAYVYPTDQEPQRAEIEQVVKTGFTDALSAFPEKEHVPYKPVVLFGLESVVEIMEEEQRRSEQSQIAETVCRQNKIPVFLLSPSDARAKHLPRAIPGAEDRRRATREQILKGIDQLLTTNPALTLYSEVKDKLEKDPTWTF
jgi:hypothetical protein